MIPVKMERLPILARGLAISSARSLGRCVWKPSNLYGSNLDRLEATRLAEVVVAYTMCGCCVR